jgi:hypothetical protein
MAAAKPPSLLKKWAYWGGEVRVTAAISNIKRGGGGQDVRGDEKNLGVRPIDVKGFAVLTKEKIDIERERERESQIPYLSSPPYSSHSLQLTGPKK